jgi:prepilin-type N-terminal cleavage/methylation domain-containing protein
MRKHKGFSLIELLIVVAIILIIAAIAIPNLLRARIAANESSSVASLRTLNTAEATYQMTFPTVGYASTLTELGPGAATGCPAGGPTAASACLVDWVLANSNNVAKSGYLFTNPNAVANGGLNTGYTLVNGPATFNVTGVRGFCSNEDGVIRFVAVGTSPPAQINNSACAAYTTLQ